MDFFGAQDKARSRTRFLLFLYVAALATIILSLYFLFFLLMISGGGAGSEYTGGIFVWELFLSVVVVTLLILGGASLVKWYNLRDGGAAVARSLGGREIQPGTKDPAERQLLNVVEEMAIASGVPMPAVFVMEEPVINAFAAGYSPHDAAIGVTRGCIEKLNRDELQGVMAHEFSHILNGDMRLNIRLIGPLFGLLVIAFLGRVLMHAGLRSSVRSRNSKNGGGQIAILLVGIAIMAIGYIGVFFGRLIQAAISRQREFLADSAAVQFTRNPSGIAGALKRIGFRDTGSKIQNDHAVDTAHMFFAKALGGGMATHPPLQKRIRAIEANWDGKFLPPLTAAQAVSKSDQDKQSGTGKSEPAKDGHGRILTAAAAVAMIGSIPKSAVHAAIESRIAMHEAFPDALNQPEAARLLLLALVLSDDAGTASRQLEHIASAAPELDGKSIEAHWRTLATWHPEMRFNLLNLAFAPLRKLPAKDLKQLHQLLSKLADVDNQLSTREALVLQVVEDQFKLSPTDPVGMLSTSMDKATAAAASRLLAFVALLQCDDRDHAMADFQKVIAKDEKLASALAFPDTDPVLKDLRDDLRGLRSLCFDLRKSLLAAAAELCLSSGNVTHDEWRTLRWMALVLQCPMPPLTAE